MACSGGSLVGGSLTTDRRICSAFGRRSGRVLWRGEGPVGFGVEVGDGVGDVEGGAPCGERRDLLFAEGFEEGGVGRCEHFEGPIRSPSFRHRVGLPEEDGCGLAGPERAQRDTSRVEGPTRDCMITEFEPLFGGVDGSVEGCWPVTTSSRDPRFDSRRVRDAQAVADPGG